MEDGKKQFVILPIGTRTPLLIGLRRREKMTRKTLINYPFFYILYIEILLLNQRKYPALGKYAQYVRCSVWGDGYAKVLSPRYLHI